jgi:hypothetical protein
MTSRVGMDDEDAPWFLNRAAQDFGLQCDGALLTAPAPLAANRSPDQASHAHGPARRMSAPRISPPSLAWARKW